jgi:hypothetical protein
VPLEVSGKVEDKQVKGRLNGGGKLLTLKSGDGSIKLEKQ